MMQIMGRKPEAELSLFSQMAPRLPVKLRLSRLQVPRRRWSVLGVDSAIVFPVRVRVLMATAPQMALEVAAPRVTVGTVASAMPRGASNELPRST